LQNLENVDSYGLEVHQASQVSPLELTTSPKHAAEPILSPFPSIGNTQPPNLDQSSSSDSSYYQATTPPDAAFYRWFGLLACDAATADDADALRLGIPSTDPTDSAISLPPLINGLSLESFRERYAIPNVIVPCLSTTLPSEGATREPWHGSEPARLTDAELCLLDNFVRNVSFWIDLHDPHNTFSTLVPHLAMRDAGLMTAILALSSRQLSISPDASSRDQDGRIGLQYYYDTLRYLQQAMTIDAYTVSLELLATALIVSMYEMLDDSGNGSGWGRHLKGVFWIQRSQLIQGETGGLKSAVWWAWLRQDVWAAFRERRKTLSFWTPTKAYVDMTAYEMAARIVWIFAKAVDFCSEEEISAGQDNVRMRIERADTLFDMLNKWEMHLPDEFKPLPGPKKKSPSDFFEPLWIHPPAFGTVHHNTRP
jgi:hypothetical protein